MRELFTTVLPPRTNVWFARAGVRLFEGGPENANYYVATSGSDTNSGTSISQPFATLSKAAGLANPGSLIYLRGGAYHWTAKVSLSRSGSAAQPIRVCAYPGEQPTLDFSGQAFSSSNRGIEIPGNWWCLYGLEIVGAGDNGIYVTGKSNTLERCVAHDCRDSGFQLHSGAAYNLVLNCDSYRNYDQNNNAAGLTVDLNTAWANGSKNFNLNHGAVTQGVHVIRNNVSIAGGSTDSFAGGTLQTNNSWQVLSPSASTTDFLSVSVDLALAPRRDDGGLPETPFFRPVPNGRLVDKGINVGEPFQGNAPDLGAFETPAW